MRFQRKKRSRGGVLVESAFTITAFLAVTLGVLDIGQVMFNHQGLVERARAGAAWAGSRVFDAEQVKNMVVYNTTSPTNHATPMYPNLATSLVTATLFDAGTTEARVVVKISNYPYTFFSPWIAGMYTARTITAVASHEASLP